MKSALLLIFFTFLLTSCGSGVCSLRGCTGWQSAFGVIDFSFGTNGIVNDEFSTETNKRWRNIALQSDGKIVVVGDVDAPPTTDQLIARYTTTGARDLTFNSTGYKFVNYGAAIYDEAHAAFIQPDSKIVMAGYYRTAGTNDFTLTRLNTDGSLDTTFNTTGQKTINYAGLDDECYSSLLLSDGTIYCGGNFSNTHFGIVKVDSTGALVGAFGVGGLMDINVPVVTSQNIYAMVYSSGSIYVGGYGYNPTSDLVVTKISPTSGAVDTTFATAGYFLSDLNGAFDLIHDIAIDGSGNVFTVGRTQIAGNSYGFILKLNSSGALDTTFSTGGYTAYTNVANALGTTFTSIILLPDGKILAGGYSHNGSVYNFIIARFTSSGQIDPLFGNQGVITTNTTGGNNMLNKIVMQPDGKIIAVGSAFSPATGRNYLTIVRYR